MQQSASAALSFLVGREWSYPEVGGNGPTQSPSADSVDFILLCSGYLLEGVLKLCDKVRIEVVRFAVPGTNCRRGCL